MTLEFDNPKKFDDNSNLVEWVWQNFQRIEAEFNLGRDAHWLQELHEEPRKIKTGMTVLADGTDWNPGAGAGVYTYYGGAWNRLG